jgi:hypothetical protein
MRANLHKNDFSRFIYPPPLQSNAFLGFSYGSLIPQQLQTQQSELGAAYWGNLARFGLFPNGSGGVAPSSFGMTNQSSSMDQLGFNTGQGKRFSRWVIIVT